MQVELKNIGHSFRGNNNFLFKNVNYIFESNKIYALCGPSGSGKSTLLSIISKMLKPTQGSIEFDNINSTRWVFQNPYGVANRTALDHIVLPVLAQGVKKRSDANKKALDFLELVNLKNIAMQNFNELSGGEAQRLMLARALASNPDLLLVDEPTAQLDIKTANSVVQILQNLSSQDTIIIIASHDKNVIEQCGVNILNLEYFVA